MQRPPLVLVHGLWDTPRLFDRLIAQLKASACPDRSHPGLLVPHLPHGLGHVPIETMARWLKHEINAAFGADCIVDILGFSMGGLISRCWIQQLEGHRRTRRFVCVGSPQRGTLTAQLVPRRWLPSIAEMKLGSAFLRQLDHQHRRQPELLGSLDCSSFFCPIDLMVVPAWRGVLPVGPAEALPAWTHPGLVSQDRSVARLSEFLLA